MRALLCATAIAIVLAACSAPAALGPAAASPSVAPLPSHIARDLAIKVVSERRSNVGVVERAEAKLLTWAEYVAVAGEPGAVNADPNGFPHIIGNIGFMGDADAKVIWVVAVAGEVWPQLREPVFFGRGPYPSATPYQPYRWGVFIVDAQQAGVLAITDAGIVGSWPPMFAQLPDHPVLGAASASADPCAALQRIPDPATVTRFPARTAGELTAGLATDAAWQRLLQQVAGVQPNPMQDARVARCRVDLLQIGAPLYARVYPGNSGIWLVPLMYGTDVILTGLVGVDESGNGSLAGNRGGAMPVPSEADARRAGALPGDAVMSAELIYATPPGCSASATAVWRLVRTSGTAVYFALDVSHATPPGVLFGEDVMRFLSGGASVSGGGRLARAC